MIRCYIWSEWSKVLEKWGKLHLITPHRSYFTSTQWVSIWMEVFGPGLRPQICVFESEEGARAAWILVRRTKPWHHLPLRRVYLGTAGEDESESPCVEYNGFVYDPAYCGEAIKVLWKTVRQSPWDEFVLDGVRPELAQAIIKERAARARRVSAYGIDLTALRSRGGYLEGLSYNSRQQLRKSFRFYERRGALAVEVARNREEAIAMLAELADLHQTTWQKRGQPGVFSSERFNAFHRQLITSFPESVQLLRVRAGDETIGLLYSFVSDGILHTYQCGFRYDDEEHNNNARPGMVVTALAVEYCLSSTSIQYIDLMAGSARYKRSLSTVEKGLGWYVVPAHTGRNMVREVAYILRERFQRSRE
jgi:hypothetical protein